MHCSKEGTLMEGPCSRPTGPYLWVPGLLQSLRPSRYALSFACSNFQDWRLLLLNLHPFQHANSKAVATCNRPLWAKNHVETPKPTFFPWIGFFCSFGVCNISMLGNKPTNLCFCPYVELPPDLKDIYSARLACKLWFLNPVKKIFMVLKTVCALYNLCQPKRVDVDIETPQMEIVLLDHSTKVHIYYCLPAVSYVGRISAVGNCEHVF